ncbi:MAG TPA: alpha/beta hydrolase [Actinomycetota bacterium]
MAERPARSRWKKAAAWAAGVSVGTAAGVAATRALIRRERRGIDPDREELLAELPPDDLGPVLAADGTLLHVRAAGDPGRPAVLLSHGFSLDMTTWHYQWKEWSKRYRVVLCDSRGHGRSSTSADRDYTLGVMGEDLLAVMDAAVPEGPVVLGGHSMGGMAILALAESHPELFGDRVAGVILADTAAGEVIRGALGGLLGRLSGYRIPDSRAERIRGFMQDGRSNLAYLVARLTNFGHHAPPWLVDYIAAVSGRTPVEVWTDALEGVIGLDYRHALEHIRVPALVVVGDVDRLTPPVTAKALAGAMPDARLVVMEGAGHLTMLERHEQFNAVGEELLERAFGERRRAGRAASTARAGGSAR